MIVGCLLLSGVFWGIACACRQSKKPRLRQKVQKYSLIGNKDEEAANCKYQCHLLLVAKDLIIYYYFHLQILETHRWRNQRRIPMSFLRPAPSPMVWASTSRTILTVMDMEVVEAVDLPDGMVINTEHKNWAAKSRHKSICIRRIRRSNMCVC